MKPISVVVPDGSMQEPVCNLFSRAGLPITFAKKRVKEGKIGVDWISRIAFQRPQEIPHYLNRGHFDLAVVGEDWIANWGYEFPVLLKLPIGRGGNKPVRIVLAAKKNIYSSVAQLPTGCEVATEYVELARRFFIRNGRTDIVVTPSYGNTESKIGFGATAIVDVTESGDSLHEHGLEIIGQLMESNTVIVANPDSMADTEKQPPIDYLVRLMNGAYQASQDVMITANVPDSKLAEASRIMSGKKGPSRMDIGNGWFALQALVLKTTEQAVIFQLLQIGVTDVVVIREIPLIMS